MNLLILGAGNAQLPAIVRAKERGLRVIAVDPSSNAPGLAVADDQYCCDLADIDFCTSIARRCDVAGILTMSAEYPIPTLAAICETQSLPGLTVAAARRATNKGLMRKAFERSGVPSPKSIGAESLEEARLARSHIPGTCIIKPAVSNGGRGVTQIAPNVSDEAFDNAVSRAMAMTRSGGILIEEFVEGPEYSVETMTWNGKTRVIAMTEKLTTGPPYFAEIGHNQPAGLSESHQTSLARVAGQGVASLGIDQAAGHVELRLSSDGPVIMEIGARLGGGFICSDLVPLSTGVDIVSAAIDVALGREPDLEAKWNRAAAIRFFRPRPGQVTSITGIDEASKLDGCHRISLECKAGDRIREIRDATDRVGYVVFSAESRELAVEQVERAISMIQIETSFAGNL